MQNQIRQASSKHAWNLFESLQLAIQKHLELFLVIGQFLNEINDQKLYKDLGEGGYDTFEQFVQNPEVGLRHSTARLYMRIYSYYIEQLKLPQADVTKIPLNRLMRLLPSLKKMEDDEARKVIVDVTPLTSSDFDAHVAEKKFEQERPMLKRCKDCGGWVFEFKPEMMCRGHVEGATDGVQIIDKSLLD